MKSLWILSAHLLLNIKANDLGDSEHLAHVRAIIGRDAYLPCGQEKVFFDGPESYIIWLKDKEFVYRFPSVDDEDKRRSIEEYYNTIDECERDSDHCLEQTSLHLKRLTAHDTGLYICRIYYQSSPCVTYMLNVSLVDSPSIPRIYSETEEITNGILGPLKLGDNLTLLCEVSDDTEETMVFWKRNGQLMSYSTTIIGTKPRLVEYVQSNLTREDMEAHYECIAQNSDVSEPLTTLVTLKMYIPPQSIEIRLSKNYNMLAGEPRVIDCVIIGSSPPPTVTWHLGNVLLKSHTHKELHDGNFTVSSLSLTVSLHETGKNLTCRAHNPHTPGDFHDSVVLTIGHKPVCMKTGSEVYGVVVGEAETVPCAFQAIPAPAQVSWTFPKGRTRLTTLQANPGHKNRYESQLRFVPTEYELGTLRCTATNVFGAGSCDMQLARGGVPQPPSCLIMSTHPSSAKIQCNKGWDGGREQTVNMQLLADDGTILLNQSNTHGKFKLPEILNGGNLTVRVYASNSRGSSSATTLYLRTLQSDSSLESPTEKALEEAPAPAPRWLARGLEASAGLLLLIVLGLAVTLMTIRSRTKQPKRDEATPDLVSQADGLFHREPDFTREERSSTTTTNITVNQLAACPNQYSSSPVAVCRGVDCTRQFIPPAAPQLPTSHFQKQQSFYV